MRILVTGGAGYIGSVLTAELVARGHAVTVFDNFMYRQRSDADGKDGYIYGDARSRREVAVYCQYMDAVIALAAIVGAPSCDRDPELACSTNAGAIETLVRTMSPSQLLIYPNSNSGYGIGGEALCTEASPLQPVSLYGRTKCEAEKIVMQRENSIAFRLATVFGTSPRHRCDLMVNDFTWAACTHPSLPLHLYQPQARRNFVHVRDVAAAFIHALDNFAAMRGKVFNCGDTSANMTKAALCDKIATHVPTFAWREVAGSDPDRRDYVVSNARLEATGWRPAMSLDDGINELVAYYADHPERCGNA